MYSTYRYTLHVSIHQYLRIYMLDKSLNTIIDIINIYIYINYAYEYYLYWAEKIIN